MLRRSLKLRFYRYFTDAYGWREKSRDEHRFQNATFADGVHRMGPSTGTVTWKDRQGHISSAIRYMQSNPVQWSLFGTTLSAAVVMLFYSWNLSWELNSVNYHNAGVVRQLSKVTAELEQLKAMHREGAVYSFKDAASGGADKKTQVLPFVEVQREKPMKLAPAAGLKDNKGADQTESAQTSVIPRINANKTSAAPPESSNTWGFESFVGIGSDGTEELRKVLKRTQAQVEKSEVVARHYRTEFGRAERRAVEETERADGLVKELGDVRTELHEMKRQKKDLVKEIERFKFQQAGEKSFA